MSGARVVLLAGGNPQVAKGDGDAPVQAWLAAAPGWKGEVARRVDALVVASVPGVRKAVRWNQPFYGVAGAGWFLAMHCLTRYVKVAFFTGAELDPPPPVASRHARVRYVHLHEAAALDEAAFDEAALARWIAQAAARPGAPLF